MFYFDEEVEFSRESWRGRIRAFHDITTDLPTSQIEKFDHAHANLIKKNSKNKFNILHRIDCHIFEYVEAGEFI